MDLGYIDLTTDVQNAVSAYNNIPALNPLIQYTNDSSQDEITATIYDANQFNNLGSTIYTPNPFTLSNNRITHATIRLNTEIYWRRQTGGFCDYSFNPPTCHADSRKVENHEMGHAQGLGHEEEPTQSIMRQGFLSFFAVQQDDKDGIIYIYGAAP